MHVVWSKAFLPGHPVFIATRPGAGSEFGKRRASVRNGAFVCRRTGHAADTAAPSAPPTLHVAHRGALRTLWLQSTTTRHCARQTRRVVRRLESQPVGPLPQRLVTPRPRDLRLNGFREPVRERHFRTGSLPPTANNTKTEFHLSRRAEA